MSDYTPERAERDLVFLQAAGALRRFAPAEGTDSAFVVMTPDRREHVISVDEVRTLRLGVLVGWRLPRLSSEVLGG